MSATPHNGKEADFQLFMGLLDADRFEGRFREGVHKADVSDMLRRLTKEELYRFDGTPLFPERIAKTVPYKLSDAETRLYREVTDYVREEFNRAEALANDLGVGAETIGLHDQQGVSPSKQLRPLRLVYPGQCARVQQLQHDGLPVSAKLDHAHPSRHAG